MAIARFRSAVMMFALGLVMLDSMLFVPTSEAHGGSVVARADTDAYRIQATVTRRGDRIDETIVVLDSESLEPAPVQVALTLVGRNGELRGPFLARPLESGHEVLYLPPDGNAGWRVRIELVGSAGPAMVEHDLKTPAREWAVGYGIGGAALGVLGFVVPAAIVLFLLLRPRREAGEIPTNTPMRPTGG